MVPCLALSAGYSFSEPYTYDATGNITNGTWYVQDYIDAVSVDINAIIYRYTTVKNTEDNMVVHVQNKNALGSGYIFRETDDWSGKPGGTINKYIPVDNIPMEYFGEGSIEIEGSGNVLDNVVRYNYRIDQAETGQKLIDIPDIEEPYIYNALEDDAISSSEADTEYSDEDEGDDKGKQEERKERALRASKDAIGIGVTAAQQAMMAALTINTIGRYEALQLDGGQYTESVNLVDTKLPENKRGLRNGLAQQILHTKMVESQYGERP